MVGYGRPPKEHAVKKGEVRNPWGRCGKPRPELDFLDEYVAVTINGSRRKVTRAQALDEALFREAMRGSVLAAKHLERRAEKRRVERAQGAEKEVLSAEENEILDRFIERETEQRLKDREGKS
ncbi:MAG: DUF5681 domain-containing protein [Methylovirgula sp.]|jgi:uncharacterized membrane protein